MTDDDHLTHAALAERLRETVKGLREDLASRGDPMLGELAHALDLVLDLTTHAHEHAMDNRERLEALAARVDELEAGLGSAR